MDVILLERIEKLGQMGDIVKVKDGFARNYLLPRAKALRANKGNLERFERERVQLEARNLELKSEAESLAQKVDDTTYVIIRQAGDTGQLYGSVTTRDIAQSVTENGTSVSRGQVVLDRPIKALGLHPVKISLHPEVAVTVTINVARTEEEADRQARGEDVTLDQFDEVDEDEALAAEEVFEDEETAREAEEDLSEAVEDLDEASSAGEDSSDGEEEAQQG